MASVFSTAGEQAIEDQPWYLRYKGSLLIVASGVVWVLGELARGAQMIESGIAPALGVIATVAAFLINRFTRDGITPSMVARLEAAGDRAHAARPSVTTVAEPGDYAGQHRADDGLPVYDGPTTLDQ